MEFENTLKKYRSVVDNQLENFFNKKIRQTKRDFLRLSYSHLKEFVLRPGKKIRPITVIMAYKAIRDKDEEKVYPISIAPELFHASSLIHDDIMDEDHLRRNKETMHRIFEDYFRKKFKDKKYKGSIFDSSSKRFAVSIAIIQGNLLYSLSFSSILDSSLDDGKKAKALKILNYGYCMTNKGQIFDLLMAANEKSRKKDYFDMAIGKTAAPISAAIVFGATLNDAKPSQLRFLKKYAMLAGAAFQVQDDIIDISKGMEKGRRIGSDLRKGNKTLIIMHALRSSNKNQRKLILDVLGNEKATTKEVDRAIKAINETGSPEYAAKYAEKKITEAKVHLNNAGLNKEGHKFFDEFADYVVNRNV